MKKFVLFITILTLLGCVKDNSQKGDLKNIEQLIKKRDYNNAQNLIDKMGESADKYNLLGIIQERLRKFEKSEQLYKKGLEIEPFHFKTLVNLGIHYVKQKKYKEGLKYFLKAERVDSENIDLILNIAHLYIYLKKEGKIEEYLKKLKAENMDHNQTYRAGFIYENINKYQLAANMYEASMLSYKKMKDQKYQNRVRSLRSKIYLLRNRGGSKLKH